MLADIIAKNLAVVFCGINPGAEAARSGHHFAGRSNRFWRVIHLAGFTQEEIRPDEDRSILLSGCGLTTVVTRATRRAHDVAHHEFLAATDSLEQKIVAFAPGTIAFLGKAAYLAMSGRRKVDWGPQDAQFGNAAVWVLPNPSGLNRGFSLDRLVRHYRKLAASIANGGRHATEAIIRSPRLSTENRLMDH
jgi:TDG/mug DNA glycosylase family protein